MPDRCGHVRRDRLTFELCQAEDGLRGLRVFHSCCEGRKYHLYFAFSYSCCVPEFLSFVRFERKATLVKRQKLGRGVVDIHPAGSVTCRVMRTSVWTEPFLVTASVHISYSPWS